MRVLFVCHRLPFPPNRGGKIRPFHMIEHLGKKHSVVVASLAHNEEELREGKPLSDYCDEVVAEILPNRTRWLQAFAALPSPRPSSLAYFWSQRLAERIHNAARRGSFDLIMVHCAFAAQYVRGLPASLRILDYGDVDSRKWFDYSAATPFPKSFGYGLESRKLHSYEKQLAAEFDICTATTKGELEEVRKLNPNVPTAVIPNGVDLSYFQPREKSPEGSAVLVFLGRMDYFPNIDGAIHFAKSVFPIIRRTIPQAQFRIVGSNPSSAVRGLVELPGVSVTGHVPDVRPYLVDASVAVAPLRIARGTQNKILQFLAMGVPVVTTPEAAKGVGAEPGRDFLVAEGDRQFAEQVVRLLKDPALCEALSTAGQQPLATAHSWPNSMRILDDLIERHTTAVETPAESKPVTAA